MRTLVRKKGILVVLGTVLCTGRPRIHGSVPGRTRDFALWLGSESNPALYQETFSSSCRVESRLEACQLHLLATTFVNYIIIIIIIIIIIMIMMMMMMMVVMKKN